MKCPRCGKQNTDNWPVEMPDGTLITGGCQDCWETDCSASWWEMVRNLPQVDIEEEK